MPASRASVARWATAPFRRSLTATSSGSVVAWLEADDVDAPGRPHLLDDARDGRVPGAVGGDVRWESLALSRGGEYLAGLTRDASGALALVVLAPAEGNRWIPCHDVPLGGDSPTGPVTWSRQATDVTLWQRTAAEPATCLRYDLNTRELHEVARLEADERPLDAAGDESGGTVLACTADSTLILESPGAGREVIADYGRGSFLRARLTCGRVLAHSDADADFSYLDVWSCDSGEWAVTRICRDGMDADAAVLRSADELLAVWNHHGNGLVESISLESMVRRDVRSIRGMVRELVATRAPLAVAIVWSPWHPCAIVGLAPPGRPHLIDDAGVRRGAVAPTRIVLAASDGVEFDGWWFAPRRRAPSVIVLAFHGGPDLQARPCFSSTFQSLTAAGIGVFAVNVRGSSGRGRSHARLDDGARRPSVWRDVEAAIAWVRDSFPGVAIGTLGVSYGGILALYSTLRYPLAISAGAGLSGLYDLESYMRLCGSGRANSIAEYGLDSQMWRSVTPSHRLSDLTRPFLMLHGLRDDNVPISLAREVLSATSTATVPATLLEFSEESHGFHSAAGRARADSALVSWFAATRIGQNGHPDAQSPTLAGMRDSQCEMCVLVAERKHHVVRYERVVIAVPARTRAPGNLLVIPVAHVPSVNALSEPVARELVVAASRSARMCGEVQACDGINTWVDMGEVTGEPHEHIVFEVVPRRTGVPYTFMTRAELPLSSESDLAESVRAYQAAIRQFAREG